MIAIIVQRTPGDKPGPDITDPLLTAEHAALERGRNEIDANGGNRALVSISGPYRRWTDPGALVAYHGRRATWRCMVRRCALTISRDGDSFSADCSLELEREAP